MLVAKYDVNTSYFDSMPVVSSFLNLIWQVFVWACSWQCVNLLVMYLAGKVRTPIQDFMICLLNQTLHMLLKCFYLNCFLLDRCQFYRI